MDINRQYHSMVEHLLPPGPAWDKNEPILHSLSSILAYCHQRIDSLMKESNPATATELLRRYEKICQLPDSCYGDLDVTIAERRNRLNTRVNLIGGINQDFYLSVLDALGYPDASINKYNNAVFTCESHCCDGVYDESWRYFWTVNIPSDTSTVLFTCQDPCQSRLRRWGDSQIQCIIETLCPSHTYVLFKYGENYA